MTYVSDWSGLYLPESLRTDTSSARTFLATLGDPARQGSGVVIADGDTWLNCPRDTSPVLPPPPPVYPPGPPGSYKPSAATVGYAPLNVDLEPYPMTGGPFGDVINGLLTLATNDNILEGWNIQARVKSKANGNALEGCKVRGFGAGPTVDFALIDATDPANREFYVVDTEIVPDVPSLYCNGFRGHDLTLERVSIHGVTDGGDAFNSASRSAAVNVTLRASMIFGLTGFGPDVPNNRPFTHNDDIQWPGGSGLTVIGNALYGFLDPTIGQASTPGVNPDYPAMNSNSVLQVTQSSGPARGLVFTDNWCYGGGATLNFDAKGDAAGNIGIVARNKFGRDSFFQGGAALNDGTPGSGGDGSVTFKSIGGFTFTDTTGNVYEDNGHPITLRIS